ncbi:MAG TPA: hypothetical protein VE993_18840 [Stellaceae bacterium]|nr:hypothetical protein [Stellaceae bacterium]
MMFIVRGRDERPSAAAIAVKAVRRTPAIVPDGAGKTDYFCVGEAEAMAALAAAGWEVVALRDGWYADDSGGGVAIWGQGKYWEVRDTPFTIKEAAGPAGEAARPGGRESNPVNVRRAVFGV